MATPTALSRPYEGVIEMLDELTNEGLKLAVCTNKSEAMTSEVLKDLGLDGFFQAVVGGDTLPVRKPDPKPLRLAFKLIQQESEGALYVGDSEVDAKLRKRQEAHLPYFPVATERPRSIICGPISSLMNLIS